MKFKSVAVETIRSEKYETRDGERMTRYETRIIAITDEGVLMYTDDDGSNWYTFPVMNIHEAET